MCLSAPERAVCVSAASDAELVLAAGNGNKQAFGALADRHTNRARRVAMRLVGNYDVACELVQEALLQAYLGLSTLRDQAHFGAWLTGIVQNVCRSHLRAQRRHLAADWPDDAELLADATMDPVALLEEQERRALIVQAVAALSPKNQVATWLYYIEAMSVDEVAQTLKVSPNAVKGRLFQARKQLHAELAPFFSPAFGAPQLRPIEQTSVQQRKTMMATISTVKILKNAPTNHYILYLFDAAGQRYLRIWIGDHEGEQIRLQLEGTPITRPMTYRYFADFLQAMAIQLEAVRIARLHEFTYYAVTQFRNGALVKELDARPSDAVGLALHAGSPIFVDEELIAAQGEALPNGVTVEHWFTSEVDRKQLEQLTVAGWQAELFKEGEARFTQRARNALQQAVAMAQSFGDNYVGTEHLLWGLTSERDGLAAKLLYGAGVTPITLNQAAIARFGAPPPTEIRAGSSTGAMPQLVPRVIQVLELANVTREETGPGILARNICCWAFCGKGVAWR